MVHQRLVKDFYKILNQVNKEEIPDDLKFPDSFNQLVTEMKSNQYEAKTFAFMLRAMVCPLSLQFNNSSQMFLFPFLLFIYLDRSRVGNWTHRMMKAYVRGEAGPYVSVIQVTFDIYEVFKNVVSWEVDFCINAQVDLNINQYPFGEC